MFMTPSTKEIFTAIEKVSGIQNIKMEYSLEEDLLIDQQKFEQLCSEVQKNLFITINNDDRDISLFNTVNSFCSYLYKYLNSENEKIGSKFQLSQTKFQIYQQRKDFLSCCDSLVGHYLECHGYPYHWLLSDSWGFYYRSIDHFTYKLIYNPTSDIEFTTIWGNLKDIYGVRVTKYVEIPFKEIFYDVVGSGNCLFVVVDGYYIPWIPLYHTSHDIHVMLITGYSKESKKLRVTDIWPNTFEDWIDFEVVNEHYMGCFELSRPNFECSYEMLISQLESCYKKIIGSKIDEGYVGLIGLKKFKDDMDKSGSDSIQYIDYWWNEMRMIVNARECFLEFLHFLHYDTRSKFKHLVHENTLELFNSTINLWYVFKRTLMKQKLINRINVLSNTKRLENIIQHEEICSQHVYKMIIDLKKCTYNYVGD